MKGQSMATATAAAPVKARRSSARQDASARMHQCLTKEFHIPPTYVKAKDGSGRKFLVEHRIGKEAGSYSVQDIMKRLKIDDELHTICQEWQRTIRGNPKRLQQALRMERKRAEARSRNAVSAFSRHLAKHYEDQGLKPLMSFVPTDEHESGVYIQGLVDNTGTPVVGDAQDVALWSEQNYAGTRNAAIKNKEACVVARRLLNLPGVNDDLKERLNRVLSGEAIVPRLAAPEK